MTIRKWLSCALLMVLSLSVIGSPVVGAAVETTKYAYIQQKTTSDLNKVWKIRFNYPVDKKSVTSKTIFVEDANKKKVSTKLIASDENKFVVEVKPTRPYTLGNYNLYISDSILSETDMTLNSALVMPFVVTGFEASQQTAETVSQENGSNYFSDIQTEYSSLVTNVNVSVAKAVYKVTVEGKEMRYQGGDRYSRGVLGVERGQSITLRAYDDKGKLLQTMMKIVD